MRKSAKKSATKFGVWEGHGGFKNCRSRRQEALISLFSKYQPAMTGTLNPGPTAVELGKTRKVGRGATRPTSGAHLDAGGFCRHRIVNSMAVHLASPTRCDGARGRLRSRVHWPHALFFGAAVLITSAP